MYSLLLHESIGGKDARKGPREITVDDVLWEALFREFDGGYESNGQQLHVREAFIPCTLGHSNTHYVHNEDLVLWKIA